MHPTFQIVIPTRDSAKWISSFLRAYRNIGVEPLYLVDTRSVDATANILDSMQARFEFVTPVFDRVESVLSHLPQFVETAWAVRFDDDEMPSKALISWLHENLSSFERPVVALSRRDCLLVDNHLFYSRLEDFYFFKSNPDYLDPQWRAFRHRQVLYDDVLHSPGFQVDAAHQFAPQEAYFIHLDWVLRSFDQRLSKLKNYEKQANGGGENFARFYFPELHPPVDLKLTAMETDEFDELAQSVAVTDHKQLPTAPIGFTSFQDLQFKSELTEP